jgi:EmrB/QacA subfamily drug resistance transporter
VNQRAVFAIVSGGVALATLDQFVVNVAFDAIGRSLHGSLSTLSWVLNAYSIVFAALLVPAGRFADRRGRRFGFLLGVAVFTVSSAACAVAGTLPELIAARVVQAVGAALLVPSSLGLLLAAYPPERRAAAVRSWGAVTGASAALGPVVGGLLVTASWRWIFLVNVPLGLAALVAGRRLLPVVERERGPWPDLYGAAVLAGGIGSVSLALVKAHEWGWASVQTIAAFVVAAACVGVFLRRSARHPSPVVEPALLRVRAFSLASAATGVYSAAFAAMLLSITLWAETGWGWSALRFGLLFAFGPLMVPLVAPRTGGLVARIGPGRTAALGCVVFATGCVLWVVLVGTTPHWREMLPGELLTGIGVGLTLPTMMGAGAASLPAERFATGSGVLSMARQIGFTLGVAIFVAVVGSRRDLAAFRESWIAAAAAAAVAAVVALTIAPRRRAVPVDVLEPIEEAA